MRLQVRLRTLNCQFGIIAEGLGQVREMVLLLPTGLTEHPNRLPKTVVVLTFTIWLAALAQFIFLCRNDFDPAARQRWFEIFGFNLHQPWFWGFLTSMLVHTDLGHMVFNTLGLWLFGWFVEKEMGWQKFSVLGFAAHILALTAQTKFWAWQGHSESSFLVGSSALVAFLAGTFCLRFRDVGVKWRVVFGWRWRKLEFITPLWWLAAFWFISQTFSLASQQFEKPTIAHLTSFFFGVTVALSLKWHWLALRDRMQRKAELSEKLGRWSEAAEVWVKIAQKFQDKPFFWLSATHCFLQAGEVCSAKKVLQKALSHPIWDESSLQKACQIAKDPAALILQPENLFSLAEQLERYRCYPEALQLFHQVSTVAEFNRAPQALLKVAELHWRLGNEVKAMQALHNFWLRYGRSAWSQEADKLAAQIRWRGEKR